MRKSKHICRFVAASTLAFIHHSVFNHINGDSSEKNPINTCKTPQSRHKPLPSDSDARESSEKYPQALWKHTHALIQTHTLQLQGVSFRWAVLPLSVVGLSHALLHDLSQVRVLHGSRHSLFIVDLFVNWKHKQQIPSLSQ